MGPAAASPEASPGAVARRPWGAWAPRAPQRADPLPSRSLRPALLLLLLGALTGATAQQTLKLSSTLTIEKTDDKAKTHANVAALLGFAREQKLEGNVVRFLDNTLQQLQKVLDTSKVVEQQKLAEVPKDFTPMKYRVKAMPKLQAKKSTVKKIAAKELRQRLQEGKDINFKEPMLVTNATALLAAGDWERVRRHWSASRIMNDEYLERELRLEYWSPDRARARLVGNMVQMEDPDMVPFSRFLTICFHGTPAKPKLPGQNTEHCEQTVTAESMVQNGTELRELAIFPELKNALPLQVEFRQALLEAGRDELPAILGRGAEKWKRRTGTISYQFFVFGPSGSGDKLHAENGLPFYDILIHGSKRWLLMTEKEMERVAEKAREALEFDKTSAYMFFEEKLPELKEEFGLKKYVEANQQAGDLIIVPSGWYRVSLELADSISFYATILSEKDTVKAVTNNNVWRPEMRRFNLAFCYDPKDLHTLPGVGKGSDLHSWLSSAIAQIKHDEAVSGILATLLQCGSVLALEKAMPELGVNGLTVCTPAVWKQCRTRLGEKLKEKGLAVSLEWLPKEAPTSVGDVKATTPSVAGQAEEL